MMENVDGYQKIIAEIEDYAVLLLDAKGNIRDWNKGAEKIKGYKPEEIIGRNFKLFYTKEDCEKGLPEKLIKDAVNSGKARDEGWRVRKDGSCFWGSILITALFDDKNQLTGFLKITRDLTDRKNLENELLNANETLELRIRERSEKIISSEKKFRQTLDNMLEGVQMHDFNWKYIYVNEALVKSSAYKKEDLLGYTLMEKYPGIERSHLFSVLQKCMTERCAEQLESEIISPNGATTIYDFSIQPVPEGIFIRSVDITERRKAENKLTQTIKELSDYKFALNQAAIVAITDQKGIITYVNENFCKISKYGQNELIGKDHRIINSGFHPKEFIRNLWVTIAGGKIWKGELRNIAKDGTYYWVDTSIIPFLNDHGKPYQYLSIRTDITERKKAEEKLIASASRHRSVVENLHEALIIEDTKGKLVYANKEFNEMFGYEPGEIEHLSLKDYTSPDSYPEIIERHHNRVSGHDAAEEFIYKGLRKDGKEIWVEARVSSILENEQIVGTQSLERDITGRKLAEEKLLKANRLYSFISAINQSIVHIKDEQELLLKACAIATGIGEFKMAWIGILNDQGALDMISMAGDRSAINDVQKYSGLDYGSAELRNTPTGMVLRSGEFKVCNDIQNDPALIRWRDEYIKHGIKANISLPIKKFGKTCGVIGFNATSENYFNEEEITLLVEAAGDITFAIENFAKEKKHNDTEQLVLKNEKRFRALIEKSADMKTLSTLDGKFIYASPSVSKVFGYSEGEFFDKTTFNFFHPDDLPDLLEKRTDLLKFPGKSFNWQYRLLHKNGQWIWCEGTLTNLLQEPAINAIVSNFRNISEKKSAERQMEFERNNMNALINNTTDFFWSVDRNLKIITFNTPFYDIIKSSTGKELIKGAAISDVAQNQEQIDIFYDLYQRAFAGEIFTEVQFFKEPVESWIETAFYPIKNGDEVIGTACHSRNITERKKAEAEREKMIEDIIQRNKNFQQFAFIVSHNLRGPVANILGISNVLKGKLSKEDKVKAQAYLVKAVEHLDEVVKDMMKILQTRTEITESNEQISCSDLVNNIQLSIENLIREENVEITSNFSEIDKIVTLKSYIHSIFYNLILNSIKYRRIDVAPRINIRSEVRNKKILLWFNDNGRGMDIEQYGNKIFGLYQRFHLDIKGKGLGLFMVKTQVEVLGGSISVKSELGTGTEFVIELPMD